MSIAQRLQDIRNENWDLIREIMHGDATMLDATHAVWDPVVSGMQEVFSPFMPARLRESLDDEEFRYVAQRFYEAFPTLSNLAVRGGRFQIVAAPLPDLPTSSAELFLLQICERTGEVRSEFIFAVENNASTEVVFARLPICLTQLRLDVANACLRRASVLPEALAALGNCVELGLGYPKISILELRWDSDYGMHMIAKARFPRTDQTLLFESVLSADGQWTFRPRSN